MTSLFLQLWGGSFYLLNKFFFLCSEKSSDNRQQKFWKTLAWASYLIGVPPWVFVFVSEHNWIAAGVESSGIPSMVLGLAAVQGNRIKTCYKKWLNYFAKLMIPVGIGISFYDFGGLVTFDQLLESGIAAGFLMGTYLLAKSKPLGYIWLAEGNICAASLMFRQGYIVLAAQQIISLCFVLISYCFVLQKRQNKI